MFTHSLNTTWYNTGYLIVLSEFYPHTQQKIHTHAHTHTSEAQKHGSKHI